MPALIDENLAARLRRFDRGYEISMLRRSPLNEGEWSNARRIWVVTIRPEGITSAMVRAIHPSLAEAVRLAVDEGEQRGWIA